MGEVIDSLLSTCQNLSGISATSWQIVGHYMVCPDPEKMWVAYRRSYFYNILFFLNALK